MEKYERTNQKILEVASELFRANGILNTEMKDIAKALGCSRSTLYRHYSGKESILFELSSDIVLKIMNSAILPKELKFANNFDALQWQVRSIIAYMHAHVDEVCFIRDFDFYFTQTLPKSEDADRFENTIAHTRGGRDMEKSIIDGVADGSIRATDNARLLRATLINACIGMAQRILPREAIYTAEIGLGSEMLDCAGELLLSAVKA